MNGEIVISYASGDRERPQFKGLIKDLGVLGCPEWHDDKLTGGLPWWEDILDRIVHAHILLPVLSEASVRSVACRRELDWGVEVKRKILPIRIDAVEIPDALHTVEVIDYADRHVDPDAASRCMAKLASAVAALDSLPDQDPPAPLPPAPEVPDTYGGVLDRYVAAPSGSLSWEAQRELLRTARELVQSDEGDHRQLAERLERLIARTDVAKETNDSLVELREQLEAELHDETRNGSRPGGAHADKWKLASFAAPRADVWKLAKHLQSWFETQGMKAALSRTSGDEVVVDCHSIGRARATGAGARLTLVLSKKGDRVEVAAGGARWADKAASAGVALTATMATGGWGWPLLAPSVVGGYRQSRIPKRAFKYIEEVIPLCNRD